MSEQKSRFRRSISIRELQKPPEHDLQKEIDCICQCLGFSDRAEDLALEIFKELLMANQEGSGISSKEITDKKSVTQGAVVYHLNIFISSGVVIKQGRKYFLRASTLDETMGELEQDIIRRMQKMRQLAKEIDEKLSE